MRKKENERTVGGKEQMRFNGNTKKVYAGGVGAVPAMCKSSRGLAGGF